MTRTVRATRASWLALLAAALVTFAGCGGDEPEIDPDNERPGISWGEPSDGDPAALVILLHGGGWNPNRGGYEQQKENAEQLQDLGYATVAIAYGKGAKGLRQIENLYAEGRERYPDLPICAVGTSAGGHLALMLAAREPDLACVINFLGPADLTSLAEQDEEANEAHREAVEAFGRDQLRRYSPVRHADRIRAEVLTILAEDDPVNPIEQGEELRQALPSAELVVLPEGPIPAPWAHGAGVQPEAQDEALQRQLDFLEEATEGR